MSTHELALLAIVHDEEGQLYHNINEVLPFIEKYYPQAYIAVSEVTSHKVKKLLEGSALTIYEIPKRGAAQARRQIVRKAVNNSDADYYHYCDLDHLITWIQTNPKELLKVHSQLKKGDYTIIGRNEQAFATHPKEWQETEKITNLIFSIETGIEADVTAGSCSMSRRALMEVARTSDAKMTDAEWPLIVRECFGIEAIQAIHVDGLQFLKINESLHSSVTDAWFSRIRLCYVISESIARFSKRNHERVSISKERVYLRPIERSDYRTIYEGIQDESLRFLTGTKTVFTFEQIEQVNERFREDKARYDWAICLHDSNKMIGDVALVDIDEDNQRAGFRIAIYDCTYRQHGYGSEAIQLALAFCFEKLKLHRLQLEVFSYNQAAIKAYQKVGFQQEGILRDALYWDGQYYDELIFSILAEDYFRVKV
ncbi:GNAT family N-acetyltransferase [Alkalihalobacillus pseudalcaliphilus]|uniref:GNAT family N-acetyltransferase n=1 Tax=Alkalihalobacillus pseudalcaliphilus TaxID=79884 RepID=UPI00235F1DDC|nr:GNAT family protein [Alkalihalobacillus pseudalcaliphilus]